MLDRSLQRELDRVHEVMFDTPGNYYIKDLTGHYIYLNQNSLDAIGCKNSTAPLGKTDLALPWAKYAQIYQKNDRKISDHNQSLAFQEPSADYQESLLIMCSQKKPFFHRGEIVGVAGISIAIPHAKLTHSPLFHTQGIYIDKRDKRKLILSGRQREVIYWIMQGLPARKIAQQLSISSRTVEHHITNIREANDYRSLKEILLNVQALSAENTNHL